MSYNKIIIAGRLVADPEIRTATNGTKVAKFRLAVDRPGKKDGEKAADFISVTAFEKAAEFAEKFLKKGTSAIVDGRVNLSTVEKDGEKVTYADVIADAVTFGGGGLAINDVKLMGRLVADPEVKTTADGTKLANVRLAVDRLVKKDGEKVTDFFPLTAWRGCADFVEKYFHKGDPLFVEGNLEIRSYEKDGKKKTAVGVTVQQCHFCADKGTAKDTAAKTAAGAPATGGDTFFETEEGDDDLPF